MSFKIYQNLAWLNDLPPAEAEAVFLDCCGSSEWARRMAAARPFPMLEALYGTAATIWFAQSRADHLEAFASHPKIGASKPAASQKVQAADWSREEQSGTDSVKNEVREELRKANRLYEDKFGFIFIICATGKTADEMLAICRARLGNSVETELAIAAEEQQKITELRLGKLLEK